jgi:glycosyltransferase involved in cell wall biosynthesis
MRVPNVTRLFGQWLADCYGNRLKYYANFPEIFSFTTKASAVILHDDGSNGDDMARLHGLAPERFFYWKNGVDPGLHRPDLDTLAARQEMGFGPDHILLFSVARMYAEKHLDRAIRILPELLREEPRVRLFLVGDGPDRPGLEDFARRLGVEHAVRFVGAQPREDLHKYFNTGDVFLSLADRTNGGNPTVEAMFCARCVVVLNTGGTAKLVQDGKTGLVLEPDRLEELPGTILSVLKDPALRRRLGEAAREWVAPQVPTIEERQRMEVEVVERAVMEATPGGERARKAESRSVPSI